MEFSVELEYTYCSRSSRSTSSVNCLLFAILRRKNLNLYSCKKQTHRKLRKKPDIESVNYCHLRFTPNLRKTLNLTQISLRKCVNLRTFSHLPLTFYAIFTFFPLRKNLRVKNQRIYANMDLRFRCLGTSENGAKFRIFWVKKYRK